MTESEEEKLKDNPNYLFPDINKVFEHLHKSGWSQINTLAYASPMFQVMMIKDNWGAYFPMPDYPLYRGQRYYYDVCKPSLYRRSWTEEQKIERLLQIEDFKHILAENPEVKELKQASLFVNYLGLAQHYGIETEMLDMTNSPLVAAFFATTTYDSNTRMYRPVEDCVSVGCIYFDVLGPMINGANEGENRDIWPVGMEALRRPNEQRGYTIKLNENDNFNTIINHPKCFRFIQNRDWSYKIFAATGGGSVLFPYDPMADKIWAMRKFKIYGLDSLDIVIGNEQLTVPKVGIQKALETKGCHFLRTTPFLYTKEELNFIENEYKKKFPNS